MVNNPQAEVLCNSPSHTCMSTRLHAAEGSPSPGGLWVIGELLTVLEVRREAWDCVAREAKVRVEVWRVGIR